VRDGEWCCSGDFMGKRGRQGQRAKGAARYGFGYGFKHQRLFHQYSGGVVIHQFGSLFAVLKNE